MCSEVFASVSAAGADGLCSCSRRVHLLSQVAWLPALGICMVKSGSQYDADAQLSVKLQRNRLDVGGIL